MRREGFVYILASQKRGTIYIGVTSDLPRRLMQHREGKGSRFVQRYNIKRLVHAERFDRISDAIVREKQLKEWRGAWKIDLIERHNPKRHDLSKVLPL